METTSESIAERYEAILYPGQTRSSAHPDRMATIGTLLGMNPVSLESCRVLELGCGSGENLISIAQSLPGSDCVGVDIAARPIAIANEMVGTLGRDNVRFEQADVMDMPSTLGEFDYIIAHGLFSWVPPEVQAKVLETVRRHLSAKGIAFISYNAYPGWHMSMAARDIMLYHGQHFTDPIKQIQQSRGILDFVAKSTLSTAEAYRGMIEDARQKVRRLSDAGLFHDDLGAVNIPFYFHQFAEMIAGYDLQFLGEADFIEMQDHLFPSDVVATIRKLANDDIVIREQFLDFLKGRKFRQSLVCHKEVAIDRVPDRSRVMKMSISSNSSPLPIDPDEPEVQRFELPTGTSFSTNHPAAKAVLLALHRHAPRPIMFDELHDEISMQQGKELDEEAVAQSRDQLADILLWTYSYDLVELRSYLPVFAATAGERPVVSPLARLQSDMKVGVTNLLHQRVMFEGDLMLALVGMLDGTWDRKALLDELERIPAADGVQKSREELAVELEDALALLARHALILA
jgi:methyltransferase-like protein/ubiquinone/menaquinone biosynthesis C-methylase UbiE